MKITFTKLPTTVGTIKVSLDGGQSFTDYNIEDIHDSGISLDDNQNYEKIMIKGPANVLKDLNVVKQINLDNSIGSLEGNADIPLKVRFQELDCCAMSNITLNFDRYEYQSEFFKNYNSILDLDGNTGIDFYGQFYLDFSELLTDEAKEKSKYVHHNRFVGFNHIYDSWYLSETPYEGVYYGVGGAAYNFETTIEGFMEKLQGKRVFMKVGDDYMPTNFVLDFS